MQFESDGGAPAMDPESTRCLLLVVREALQNAVRHAAPHNLRVRLGYESGRLRICVADDGCGFDPSAADSADGQRYGLLGMRERIRQMGGRLDVDSAPGRGTEVLLEVPVRSRRSLLGLFG